MNMSSSSTQAVEALKKLYDTLSEQDKVKLNLCSFEEASKQVAEAGAMGEIVVAIAAQKIDRLKVRDTVPGLLVRYDSLSSMLTAYVKAEWKRTIDTEGNGITVDRIIALSPERLAAFAKLIEQCELAQEIGKK